MHVCMYAENEVQSANSQHQGNSGRVKCTWVRNTGAHQGDDGVGVELSRQQLARPTSQQDAHTVYTLQLT